MIRILKKVILGALSVLGISLLVWVLVAMNPNWVYAHETNVDFVTIHHNEELPEAVQQVVGKAINIIKEADLYSEGIEIDLCFNDHSFYPRINPLVGKALAYAMLNKTILRDGNPNFKENKVVTRWEANNFELRKFDLVWLLAHEFTHNLQYESDPYYTITSTLGKINWKLEGHAEYVSRQYRNDGQLRQRLELYQAEESKIHTGFPILTLEDGNMQILSYLKYSLIIQYMLEVENLSFDQVCRDERSFDEIYDALLEI